MCLNHASEEQIINELNRRIDQGKVKFHFVYYCDTDSQQLQLTDSENDKQMLSFNQTMEIEKAYFCRQIYKNNCEKKEQEKKSEASQKKIDEFFKNFKND
jgi:hypothetical protein